MFGPELRQWLLSLNEYQAVALLRSLLMAEASRAALPSGAVRMTGNVKAKDEGVDARTNFPAGSAALVVPEGPQTWQVKATRNPPDVASELVKSGVREDLESGSNYVLAWTRDESPVARTALEAAIPEQVADAFAGRNGRLFGTEDIERLAEVHPAVIATLGGPGLLGLPLTFWAAHLHVDELPFVSDPERDIIIETLRTMAASLDEGSTHLHLYGDTGVGKPRLAFEALADPALRERVFVCPGIDDVDPGILQRLVTSPTAHAIVLVDDVTWSDAQRFGGYAAAARGRLRLLTIGERPDRDSRPGRNSIDIRPLAGGVIATLASSVAGIGEDQAQLVAGLADGYPKLAVELGRAIARSDDPASILELIRTNNVHALLQNMLPDDIVRRQISHLAIVSRLGFEGGLEYEANQLCDAFDLDPMQFRAAIEAEHGRFVSEAGRYRLATPRAFAVWLVGALIREAPGSFADRVVSLPEQLFESFRRQVEVLGEDPYIAELLTEVMARKGGTFLRASAVTPEFARLLEAISFAMPDLAADRLAELVAADDPEGLRGLDGERRRSFVWALSHLLWFSTTFAPAASSLFRLALAENESYGNNATGVLTGVFGTHLGGTEVPLRERVDWLATEYPPFGVGGAELTIRCAATSLQLMETRMGGWRGARLQPEEWHPREVLEEQDARRSALELLGTVLRAYPELELAVAKAVSENFRGLVSRGMSDDVLSFFAEHDWGHRARSAVVGALRETLHYEEGLPDALREKVSEALDSFGAGRLEDRLAVALSTPYWDLSIGIEEKMTSPAILVQLAAEVAESPTMELVESFSRMDSAVDETTSHAFYQLLGERDRDRHWDFLARDAQASIAARTGYVIGQHKTEDADWTRDVLSEWATNEAFAPDVSIVVHQMPASPETLSLALAPVESGLVPVSTLNRLMLGAWIKPLAPDNLARILDLYLRSDLSQRDLDAALHMLLFWIDDSAEKAMSAPLSLAEQLLARTSDFPDSSGGIAYTRNKLLNVLPLSDDARLSILLTSLAQPVFPDEGELALLEEMASSAPSEVAQSVVDLLLSDREGWSLYLSRAHLVSRLARVAGLEPLLEIITGLTPENRILLLQHVDFTSTDPDPFFVALLESSSDSDMLDEARVRYFYPGEVVVGSYANYLQRRLETLRAWVASTESAALASWAESLTPLIEKEIQHQLLRESEEDLGS